MSATRVRARALITAMTARGGIDAMTTCKDCDLKESAPDCIRRCVSNIYFCPIHDTYVRPDEPSCEHGEREDGTKLSNH